MHIESPGRIGRAEGTNRRLRRKHPLYAYIDSSYPVTPPIRAVTGLYTRHTSAVLPSPNLLVAHAISGQNDPHKSDGYVYRFRGLDFMRRARTCIEAVFAALVRASENLTIEDYRRRARLSLVCNRLLYGRMYQTA